MSKTLKVYTTKEELCRIRGISEIRSFLPASSELQDLVTFLKDSSNIAQLVCMAEYVIKNRERTTRWNKANPGKSKIRLQKWKLKNLDRLIAIGRIYRDMNRKKIYLKNKRWKIKNPEYMKLRSTYDSIRNRCNNPNNPLYKYYGGKGVKCLLTFSSYCNLLQRYNYKSLKKPSIDRINSDGHYSINNCRIIELSENSRKRIIEKGNPNPKVKK